MKSIRKALKAYNAGALHFFRHNGCSKSEPGLPAFFGKKYKQMTKLPKGRLIGAVK